MRHYVLVPFPLSLLGAVRCLFCFRGFASLELFMKHDEEAHR